MALGRSEATLGVFASPYQDPNMLADSARDFQTVSQGFLGWEYGYYPASPFTPSTFTPFPRIRDQFWDISDSYWTSIGRTLMHGNGTTGAKTPVVHHAVRRWTSDYEGQTYIAIRLDRLDYRGNGALLKLLAQNGSLVAERFIGSNDDNGEELYVPLTLKLGQSLDFAVDPVNGDDAYDSTDVRIEIYKGKRVNGSLSLGGRNALPAGTQVLIQVVQPGFSETLTKVAVDAQGEFAFNCNAPSGPTTFYFKASTGLRKAIVLQLGRKPVTELEVQLLNGDCNGDNYIGTDDYLILNDAFDTSLGDAGFDSRADLNGDGYVGTDDYLILNENFDLSGD